MINILKHIRKYFRNVIQYSVKTELIYMTKDQITIIIKASIIGGGGLLKMARCEQTCQILDCL